MKRISARQNAKQAARKPLREAQLRKYPFCEGRDYRHVCFGGLTVHEPWTRARGGPIDDARNMVTVCAEFNRRISQDAAVMRWATLNGFLIHSAAGPEWLAAGGFRTSGPTAP